MQTRPDRADGESAPDVLEALSQDAMGRFKISQRILRSSSGRRSGLRRRARRLARDTDRTAEDYWLL